MELDGSDQSEYGDIDSHDLNNDFIKNPSKTDEPSVGRINLNERNETDSEDPTLRTCIEESGPVRDGGSLGEVGPMKTDIKPETDSENLWIVQRCKELSRVATSSDQLIKILYAPMDPSSIAVSRFLFGLLMFFDIPEERGLSEADLRWGDPEECRFPLFDFLQPLPLHWMCLVYLLMWLGALGLAVGAYFRLSCLAFALPYWYIFLLDKTAWNNHSYLYGILAVIFLTSDAHYYWSIDSWRGKVPKNMDIPAYNYHLLRYQLFLLYFHAGIKKTEFDWLAGHSMTNLAKHWVFHPFRIFMSTEEVDLYIVHGFGFLLDLTVGFLIYFDRTRLLSFPFLICFHLMNSQMFYIGMFPFVCLVTMPIFCKDDWPKTLFVKNTYSSKRPTIRNPACIYSDDPKENSGNNEFLVKKKKLVLLACLVYGFIQLILPYSHFITKGYNNWTNGLYGYSWDMMVHSWDTSLATVKVVNHDTNKAFFIDPEAWVPNNKWLRHADMIKQYSKCIHRNLANRENTKNISIYIDVWHSLNKRVHQRMFDPRVDLVKAEWGPFSEVSWLMPLLHNLSHWRSEMRTFEKEVHSWSNASDLIFMADFPGLSFQNYIHKEICNVTLLNLQGKIGVEVDMDRTYELSRGDSIKLPPERFHVVHTLSASPSLFVYTFSNLTKGKESAGAPPDPGLFQPSLFEDLSLKVDNLLVSVGLVSNGFLRAVYSVPMIRRVRIPDADALPRHLHNER